MIVAIFVLSIRYFKEYARLRSHTSFDKEARRVLGDIKYNDPKLICDFCGGQINTLTDKVCPHCGADYAGNKEWKERYDSIISSEYVSDRADDAANLELNQVRIKLAKTIKYLRISIISLAVIIGVFIIIGVALMFKDNRDFLKANELNERSYDSYEACDYGIEGDGIVVNAEGLEVSVVGLYRMESYAIGDRYKVAYCIKNNSGKDLRISIHSCAVNDVVDESFIYGWVHKGADFIYYATYGIDGNPTSISRIVYNYVGISDQEYGYIYESNALIEVNTKATEVDRVELPTENILFENDYIVVQKDVDSDGTYRSEKRYYLRVYNKTDKYFVINSKQGRLKGETIEISGINRSPLYDNCVGEYYIMSYDDSYSERVITDDFLINISVSCEEDPTLDFSTGYFELL